MTTSVERLTAALADRYRLERELGAGGMATVYLAEDLKHDRKVAIKVLRPELAAVIGAQRFLAEIKTTANLQHPHILSLFDSGEVDGTVFYVMPYIEGESLRDRLTREKQLPIADAVRIATEVANALDYAHRHGVIHRDIKPENILLHDGSALVADFGIALAASKAGTRMTETGMSLGTPHYMSPEQAMGEREITVRSDVYALGCVLYEMLVGEPPFTGPTAQAIVAKVMADEPRPPSQLRRTVPSHVEGAALTALAKLPADRFATAAEFAAALGSAGGTLGGGATTKVTRPRAAQDEAVWRRRSLPNWQAAGLVAAGSLAALAFMRMGNPPPQDAPVVRFSFPARLLGENGAGFTISPDGGEIVFVSRTGGGRLMLFRRSLASGSAVPIPGTESSWISSPFFSPDGGQVGYFSDQRLRAVPLTGGTPRTLAPVLANGQGGTWTDDGRILYQANLGEGLRVVPAAGGESRVFTVADSTEHFMPQAVPGGRWALVTGQLIGGAGASWIGLVSLKDGSIRHLLAGSNGQYAQGHLVFESPAGTLAAIRFDPDRGTTSGTAMVLSDSLQWFALAGNGTVVFAPQTTSLVPVLVDRKGAAQSLSLEPGGYLSPRFSHDGRAFAVGRDGVIWVHDMRLGTFGPITRQGLGAIYPLWTPSDARVIYSRTEGSAVFIESIPIDRSTDPVPLLKVPGQHRTQDLSRDGRYLLLRRTDGANYDLMYMRLSGDSVPIPWLATPEFAERGGSFSPSGRWVAYSSNEAGLDQIFVRPFPGPGGAVQVSTEGGSEPAWAPDGRELFYRAGDRMQSVAVDAGERFQVLSPPRTLFAGNYASYGWQRQYDVHPDGRRFLMLKPSSEESEITVVINWMRTWPRNGAER